MAKKTPMINDVSRMKKMTRLLISLMREEKLYSIFQKFILHYILSCEGGIQSGKIQNKEQEF